MINAVIDTSKNVHVKIDTVIHIVKYVQATSGNLDIIEKVNNFYDSAWSKLLWVIGVAGAIIGIIVPFVIQYWQNKRLIHGEEKLRKDIEKAINLAKTEILTNVDIQVKEKLKNYNEYLDKAINEQFARVFQIQGNIQKSQFNESAMAAYMMSIKHLALTGRTDRIIDFLDYFANSVNYDESKFDIVAFQNECDYYGESFTEILKDIEANHKNRKITSLAKKALKSFEDYKLKFEASNLK